MNKAKILDLYDKGNSYRHIARVVGCSIAMVSYYCSELRKRKSTNPGRFDLSRLQEYQTYYDKCGSATETASYFGVSRITLRKYLLKKVSTGNRKNYYRDMRKIAIDYKGGKCEKCGYDKSSWALDFHHKDPEQKSFSISKGKKSFETLKPEIDKCELLCKNCHAEEHENIYNMKNNKTKELASVF